MIMITINNSALINKIQNWILKVWIRMSAKYQSSCQETPNLAKKT